jgi:hypothetical protein
MSLSRILLASAIACAFCVLLIFLFPANTGPFPVVHGPATALRAKHAADLILLWILLCGLTLAGHTAIPSSVASWLAAASDCTPSAYARSLSVLRC